MPKQKEAPDFKKERIPSIEEVQDSIRTKCEEIIQRCLTVREAESFFRFEKTLHTLVSELGCLFFHLFLLAAHHGQDYTQWLESGLYSLKPTPISRTLKTIYGKVRYWRSYLVRKGKPAGGFYPLDIVLGLTRDGFSPFVMSLATKLATRVSFATSTLLFRCFYGWSPSSESIEHLVLGIGREASAYMEVVAAPEDDGEVLIIEVDGKATPTATDEELAKRRGRRKEKKRSCCQRHRGKDTRRSRKRKRRKKGDKSKNGRSTTIVVMYTLKRGADGKLHGPLNKTVWASYAPRKVMLNWARRQATTRGFPPGTKKRIHIAVDGERCLQERLTDLFPTATFALDIRHLEEYLWKVGRAFYAEGSAELDSWIEDKRSLLYEGRAAELLDDLNALKTSLSSRAKRDARKREVLTTVIQYMEPRLSMMAYNAYIEEDVPIATGIVEGAARYVVGERMDCSGMRWIPGKAEALLQLRCIELNGEWDQFFDWAYTRWREKLQRTEPMLVRTNTPIDLSLLSQMYESQEVSHVV